jgi:hypothetical protein
MVGMIKGGQYHDGKIHFVFLGLPGPHFIGHANMSTKWPDPRRIASVGKFSKWLSESIIADKGSASAYRGQSDSGWPLKPSLDRILPEGHNCRDWLKEEKRIESVFRCQALRFLGALEREYVKEKSRKEKSRLDCMMVMRHFGVPTRLLDWTWSAAVAAYFACIGERDCDGTIWRFNSEAVRSYVHKR